MLKTRAWTPYAYIAPALLLIGFVFAYPVAQVFNFSFRLIRGNSGPWVGFNNYRLIFDDPTFIAAAKHSAILLLAVPVLLAISIVVSVLLFERARGWKVYRSVLFFPYILAVAVVGIVASYIFQLNGVLNTILRGIGLGGPDWLGDDQLALFTLMLVIVWREVGFGIVLFLARLLSLPEEQIKAIEAVLEDYRRQGLDFHALRTRKAGARRFIEFHLLVPGETSVRESHELCDRIEESITGELAKASVTIHVEPQEAHEPHGLPP